MALPAQHIIRFMQVLDGLKKLERWKGQYYFRDYPQPERYESVADHTWRMAMLLIAIEPHLQQAIDFRKAMTMALIHDIPEIITGDPSPLGTDGKGKGSHAIDEDIAQKKYEDEKRAAKKIFGQLPVKQAEEIYALWLEYEEQASLEARIIKAIDRIEGKLQSIELAGKHMVPDHVEFTMNYGVTLCDVDPAIAKLMKTVLQELQNQSQKDPQV